MSESEEAHAVFYLHEGALEEANDVASFVGLFKDYLFELWVGSYLGQFSISSYELSIGVAHVSSVRGHRVQTFCDVCQGGFCLKQDVQDGGMYRMGWRVSGGLATTRERVETRFYSAASS